MIASRIQDFSAVILPIVFDALVNVADKHWNSSISMIASNVLTFFLEVNLPLYQKLERDKQTGTGKPSVQKQSSKESLRTTNITRPSTCVSQKYGKKQNTNKNYDTV